MVLLTYSCIVKIDSITRSFCLCQFVQNGLSYPGDETRPKLCISNAMLGLASALLEQIKISCYTEYKALGPSLIYNSCKYCQKAQTFYLGSWSLKLTCALVYNTQYCKLVDCRKTVTKSCWFLASWAFPLLSLFQCFSTFFGSRHPLRLIKFWRHPYVVQTTTWGTLICKSPQVWLRTLANPKVGGTPATFSRHPGWESLLYLFRTALYVVLLWFYDKSINMF
jgi:hypothetical protein